MIRYLACVFLLLGSLVTPSYANPTKALNDLILVRCLPSLATGTSLNTKGLKRISKASAKQLTGSDAGKAYIGDTQSTVLVGLARNACGVFARGVRSKQIWRFAEAWFNDPKTPFRIVAKQGASSREQRRLYMGVVAKRRISVTVSASDRAKRAVITLQSENL